MNSQCLNVLLQLQRMVKVINNYTLIQRLGSGEFGEVYRAVHAQKPGEFAVKAISAEKVHDDQRLELCTVNEVQILKAVGQCQNIVHFQQHFQTKNNYYFVYQYCNGGTLLSAIRKQGAFSEQKALKVFRQLMEAFKVLHRSNIMHRDLKPENILLSDGVVKLGDFGFSKGLKQGQNMTKTMLGSPIYMAPQVLRGQNYTSKADIWSLGVVLYQMIFGVCPFQSNSIANLISQINNCQVNMPSTHPISQKTRTILKKMLTKDYFRRISWVELFSYRIDQDGNYVDNELPASVHNFTSHASIKDNQEKTASPTPTKPISDVRKFYSEKYMNAIGQHLLSTHTTQKALESPSAGEENQIDHIQGAISSSKRARLVHTHQECLDDMKISLSWLKKGGASQLGRSLSRLHLVHRTLKQMYDEIRVPAQSQLLDLASLVNIEIIQIDRQMIDMKQEMMRRKMTIPKECASRSRSRSPDTSPFDYR